MPADVISEKDADFEQFFPQIVGFVLQSLSDEKSLKTAGYQKKFKDLNVEISFGTGQPAQITWMCFLKDGEKIQKGYYPGLYFYRERAQLFVVLGVSDDNKPMRTWPPEFSKNYKKFADIENPGYLKERYPDSFLYAQYTVDKNRIQESLDSIKEPLSRDINHLIEVYNEDQQVGESSNSIIISKIAWSYNGWSGFDQRGYQNRERYGYDHVKKFGLAHEWWSFHDFGGDSFLGHIEIGEKNVKGFQTNGLVLIASVNFENREYNLVGFYGKAEFGNFPLPMSLWDTLSPVDQDKITTDAANGLIDKSAPEELKRKTSFNWRGKKDYSTIFKHFVPFDPKDFGVPLWGRAPYIIVGRNPEKFSKEQTKQLLVRAIEEHKKLLLTASGSEKEEIETVIKKTETVLKMYFDKQDLRKYWQVAPGPQASSWPLCVDKGIIPIFFEDTLGKIPDDILSYSKEQIIDHCKKSSPQLTAGQIGARVGLIWDFIHSAQIGDYVLANKGQSLALGWGVITSEAKICKNGSNITFYRHVDWKNTELNQKIDPELDKHFFTTILKLKKEQFNSVVFPQKGDEKTAENPVFAKIQNILDYKKQVILYGPPGTGKTWTVSKFVEGRRRFEPEVKTISTDKKFFWFSANPSFWDPNNLWKGGETELTYGSIRSSFNDIEQGDLIFVYVSKDNHRMFGIATCSKKAYDTNGIPKVFIKGLQPISGPQWAEMKDDSVLSNAKPVRMGARGTLFPLDQYEGLRILEMAKVSPESIGLSLTEQKEKIDTCTFVTFHPSYSYEEFIEGLRPEKDENGNIYYKVQEGIFKRACRIAYNALLREAEIEAEWDSETGVPHLTDEQIQSVQDIVDLVPVYFVIDEINRGDISRIFGELITLIEADKRLFSDTKIPCILPYSKQEFGIPPNLYIIGTMNTADRSISLMDIALRRRFGFCELIPDYPSLEDCLLKEEKIDPIVKEHRQLAINVLKAINYRLQEKYDRDHQIGHSYFIKLSEQKKLDETDAALENIWKYEILPLLQEYFFDSSDKLLYVLNDRFYSVSGTSFTEKPEENFIAALQTVAQQKPGN